MLLLLGHFCQHFVIEYNCNAKIITILSKKNKPLHVNNIIVTLSITVVTEILCKNSVSIGSYSPYFVL